MIVGLTGGIGSGKTTVAKMFEVLGVPVYVSDIEAKKLMVTSSAIIKSVTALFGDEAYIDGQLNRSLIADKAFNNPDVLAELNGIVHPVVGQHFNAWVARQEAPYVIKEAAILFESGGHATCDFVITVTAPIEERIKRVRQRDKVSEKQVNDRINNQMSDKEKIAKSDFVINNIDRRETQQQVIEINSIILNKIEEASLL